MRKDTFAKTFRFWKPDSHDIDPNQRLKVLVWIYFLLWVFEGALRKWFIPALSTPLLLVRDPIVVWLIILASRRGLLKANIYYSGMIILGILSILTAVFLGHGNLLVALYGARNMLLYFPLIFIIGRVFNEEDVIKMGKMILYISIPMTILLVLQFYSPQSSWVNRGVGGDEAGAGFGGALGYFRPPGTFSFTNGVAYFYSLVTPFLIYFLLTPKKINKKILIAANAALLIAIPISISRGLFFQVAVSVIFLLLAISRKPKYSGKVFIGLILVAVCMAVFSNIDFFNTATDAFTSRFDDANKTEGGLVKGVLGNRFLGALIAAITTSADSVLGYGVGSGTAVGANLLNYYNIVLVADFEWIREIAELGIMGLFLIAFRVGLALKISMASYYKLKKDGLLPWLIMSVALLVLTQGTWNQPTSLGFCSLISGLWLASLKTTAIRKITEKQEKKLNEKELAY